VALSLLMLPEVALPVTLYIYNIEPPGRPLCWQNCSKVAEVALCLPADGSKKKGNKENYLLKYL